MTRLLVKLKDYAAIDIGNVLVIDPQTELLYRFHDGVLSPLRTPLKPLRGSPATQETDANAAKRN